MTARLLSGCSILAALLLPVSAASGQVLEAQVLETRVPEAIAAPGETLVATIHAQGAQVYVCAPDAASGRHAWQFREPIATLIVDGKTVGRHYAGPNWELADGSAVVAKAAGRAAGASDTDIPLLKLDVMSRRGSGQLSDVTTIQRLNTKGGVAVGDCAQAGALLSVPYSADYAFYRKTRASALPAAR